MRGSRGRRAKQLEEYRKATEPTVFYYREPIRSEQPRDLVSCMKASDFMDLSVFSWPLDEAATVTVETVKERNLEMVQPKKEKNVSVKDQHYYRLYVRAKEVNKNVAMTSRFRQRLWGFLQMKPIELMTWADDDVGVLTKMATNQSKIAVEMDGLNPQVLIDTAASMFSKKKSFLSSFFGVKKSNILDELNTCKTQNHFWLRYAMHEIDEIIKVLVHLAEDILVLQIVSEDMKGQNEEYIANGRLKTLIASQHVAMMTKQAIDNSVAILSQNVQNLEHTIDVLIPSWTLEASHTNKTVKNTTLYATSTGEDA
jgi:hypothetical protein